MNRITPFFLAALLICAKHTFAGGYEGTMPVGAVPVHHLGLTENVVLIEGVSDERLLNLYNAASLFVFPSLEEGFGNPPSEAMACGTPVIASNTTSLPEVLGDAAILVPPTDTEALADAMIQVLNTPSLAEELRHRGLQRSLKFSWERTARETLAVYEKVASSTGK